MVHCKPRWFLAVLLPIRNFSFFVYIEVFSPICSVQLYQLSSHRFWMSFPSVPRSLWILSPVPKSLDNHSNRCPSASLSMKDGANELNMQMPWARCIPPRFGLYASVTKLSAVCYPCRQLR